MDRHGMPETFEEYKTAINSMSFGNWKHEMIVKKLLRDYREMINAYEIAEDTATSLRIQGHKPDDINLHYGKEHKPDDINKTKGIGLQGD